MGISFILLLMLFFPEWRYFLIDVKLFHMPSNNCNYLIILLTILHTRVTESMSISYKHDPPWIGYLQEQPLQVFTGVCIISESIKLFKCQALH